MYSIRPSLFLILVACLVSPLGLTGCGDYQSHIAPPASDYDTVYTYEPTSAKAAVKQNAPPVDDTSATQYSDALTPADDPLVKAGDPLVGHPKTSSDKPDFVSNDDPMIESKDHSDSYRTAGRYWVNGNIRGGVIEIFVNGIPAGRFGGHVDKEITTFCNRGSNTLTFTHYPYDDSGVCPAHLEILNGRAAKGSPPVLTYDTTLNPGVDSTNAASSTTDLQAPTLPNMPKPPDASGSTAGHGPTSETRTFLDI